MRAKLWATAAVAAVLVGAVGIMGGVAGAQSSAPSGLTSGISASTSSNQPQGVPWPAAIPEPQNRPYAPGQMTLNVDVTDLQRGIFQVRETIPVAEGPVTLLYPRWLPGNHSPSGPIEKVANIRVTANGQPVPWVRDTVDVYAFHVAPPAGTHSIEVSFQYLSPTQTDQGRVTATLDMVDLQWNTVALYPAGAYARQIMVQPNVTFPHGFQFGTALETDTQAGDTVHFKPIDFDDLVDSPIYAGRNFRRVDLNPGGDVPVHMDIIADQPEQLAATPAQVQLYRNLIQQEFKLYGSHHYNHYDALFSLSNSMGGNGLEHHRSSENGTGADYFTKWDDFIGGRDLIPHETTHSWNGKWRRPADLWTPNFNVPMRDSLLWVYEGQTQYWGMVLTGRSGLWTRDQALEALANTAATYDVQIGRTWRPLEDTTNDPIIARRQPQGWRSWERSEDYYSEGQLIWLDADTLIRERTHGQKSLDNFAHAFFGPESGSFVPHTYTFDDVVATLNGVMPYDWASFLHERLDRVSQHAPLDGIARGGYRLVYNDQRSDFVKAGERRSESASFTYSIGIAVANANGRVSSVLWDSPAFNQGVTVGTLIQSVSGQAYSADVMRRAITTAKNDTSHPIELIIRNGDRFRTVQIDYHGGLRYPHLERVAGQPDRLSKIYAPRH